MEIDCIYHNGRLATMDRSISAPYGALLDHALCVKDDRIVAILPMSEVPESSVSRRYDLQRRWVTPGLIDCHTHAVYGGTRYRDWNLRLAGETYVKIAEQGGGILSTVESTRKASQAQLLQLTLSRVSSLMAEGVTCVEIKSGYGLTVTDELKMLAVAREVNDHLPVEVSTTLLAAHTVPNEFRDNPDEYVDLIVKQLIPLVANDKLAEAVDVFCEKVGFTVSQCERIWSAARQHGLAVKGHVEQLSNTHGTVALCRHKPWSADHIEYLDDAGVDAMAQCHTVAVLLPGAFYFLREKQLPPVNKLRQAGVPMAVASDLNPGTSPFASLRLAMNMACVLFGLNAEEALAGATRVAAQAIGRAERIGTLSAGKQADFLLWDVDDPSEIVLSLGMSKPVARVFRGRLMNEAA